MWRGEGYGDGIKDEIVKIIVISVLVFFFNDTATTEIYTLSLHDALPICAGGVDRAQRSLEPGAFCVTGESYLAQE